MSNIYIQEPSTLGKVLLTTTVGDIDIELWSKECPLACRNFIQLCEEGYYEGTIFHRLVKNFIVQGGDPTGTGHGGDSIYGETFKDEFHSRLRFVRRGLVAMANAGPSDNGSQFFFTLDQCPELNNKHTIFGKVVGDTLFNMVKLADTPTDSNDRPKYPHKIIKTKVLNCPFDNILPRAKKSHKKSSKLKRESKSAATKDFTLLSFGEEAEDDDINCDIKDFKTVKSIHDCFDDKKMSKDNYVPKESDNFAKPKKPEKIEEKDEEKDKEEKKEPSKLDAIRNEFNDLKSEMKNKKQVQEKVTDKKVRNEILEEHHASLDKIKKEKKQLKGPEREKQTLMLLNKFKNKMHTHQLNKKKGSGDEVTEENWLGHSLKFEEDAPVVENDKFIIQDPRKADKK